MKILMTLFIAMLSHNAHAANFADFVGGNVFLDNLHLLRTQYGDALETHMSAFFYPNSQRTTTNTCQWSSSYQVYNCVYIIRDNNGMTESYLKVKYKLIPGEKTLVFFENNVFIEEGG